MKNKVADSLSRPLIGSTDGVGENAERKPPGLRYIESCKNCVNGRHYQSYADDVFCKKYEVYTDVRHVCNDYE